MPEPLGKFAIDKPVYAILNKIISNPSLHKIFCLIDPNYVTFFNIFLSFQVVFMYLHNSNYTWLVFFIRSFLDIVDGTLARKCNRCSRLGHVLDNLGDLLFYILMMLSMLYLYPQINPLKKLFYIFIIFYIIKNFSGNVDKLYMFLHDNSLLTFMWFYICDRIAHI